jgi:beta-glucosidase
VSKGAESGPAAGFSRRGYGGVAPLDALRAELPDAAISYLDGKDVGAAATAAKAADLVIMFAEKFATEAADHADLSLGEGQDALIDAVSSANGKTVVVLETGNPVLMPWRNKVPAILSAWYGGQRGGTAIARVLTGKVNPSGHLPVTFPASVDQLPNPVLPGSDVPPADKETRAVYGLQAGTKPFDIRYPEGSDAGYRWFDKKGLKPLYPFGYGLSYTQFRYDGLKTTGGKTLTVRFTVTNIGQRAGADVPQVYVTRPGKAKRLVGWAKPDLKPGESKEVTVTADMRVLSDFDPKAQRWVLPAGEVKIEVGTSAADPVLIGAAKLNRFVRKP